MSPRSDPAIPGTSPHGDPAVFVPQRTRTVEFAPDGQTTVADTLVTFSDLRVNSSLQPDELRLVVPSNTHLSDDVSHRAYILSKPSDLDQLLSAKPYPLPERAAGRSGAKSGRAR